MKFKDLETLKDCCADYIDGEVWKAAIGYKYYLVSNYGRVYSIRNDRVLKPNIHTGGYLDVRLKQKYGGFKRVILSRLIATMFVPNPENKPIVHHIDGDIKNNKADNLMWVTAEEHKEIHRQMRQAAKLERQQKGGDVNE